MRGLCPERLAARFILLALNLASGKAFIENLAG
jgi:hypothetical protein